MLGRLKLASTLLVLVASALPAVGAVPSPPPTDCGPNGGPEFASVGDGYRHDEMCVEVEPGVTLRVIEGTSPAARARAPRRALLLMGATLVDRRHWATPNDPTFDGVARGALAGFHTYSFDYYGYAESTKPASGLAANRETLLRHTGALIEWIRARSGAAKVDMAGISLGSLLAFAVGGVNGVVPTDHVGKLVLTSIVYRNAALPLQLTLLSPAGCAAMANAPDGYIHTAAPIYAPLISDSEPEAQVWCYQHCPGRYASGPTLTGCDLPVFEASTARNEALVLLGGNDKASVREDVDRFVAEYGGRVTFEIMPGGAHTFHWEPIRDAFWARTFDFLG